MFLSDILRWNSAPAYNCRGVKTIFFKVELMQWIQIFNVYNTVITTE